MAPREDDGGGDFAGIDPVLMRSMIKDLEGAKGLVEEHVPGLKDAFSRVGLSTKPIGTLAGVAGWIGGELGMLNRRQRMAEQLSKENDQFGFTGAMVQTEWEGFFKSPAEAEAKAKELAGEYQKPGGFPDDAWEQIRKYQSDPDFARAFLKQLGPEKAAWVAGRLRTWDEEGSAERLAAFGRLMAVASHQGLIDEAWLKNFTPNGGGGGPSLYDLAALMKHGVWNKDTLVMIGQQALKADQAAGGNYLTADILDAVARNPMAASELYGKEFDRINSMMRGQAFGWVNTTDPKLGDPLARFMKSATVEAAEAYERTRPPGDDTWQNPADRLALRIFQEVAAHGGENYAFEPVDDAFIDVVERFFRGDYDRPLLPQGTMTFADAAGLVADLVGIFDPTPISDGVSGVISLGQGDWKGALLSMAAMIPYFGDAGAKPVKTFLRLIENFPGLKAFFKVPADDIADESKLAAHAKAIKEGFESLKNTLKNVGFSNPGKILDALGVVNRLQTDAAKFYAKYPKIADAARAKGLPVDGPIPFVPKRGWDPKKANPNQGIEDAYGNVWQKGKRHGRGTSDAPSEWDVQVKNSKSGLGTLTADGSHLNVEWGTGRLGN
ncbi:hypothetical protein Sru01_05000 [Sphaerisporangium rufum]|uniref:Novel toxin 17 domain-containing protein n=1 Tax=Sphaerisporangium rufum TaxID=1381558 RepID=A0A919QYB5_9ACTN|nr:polymorphic toxin type 17 domain-containing protein [Sphaerisporangium rufum]GII75518.1 hypothetical protein Sru01_05000 [Sphaerisporangium rufum]